jgi:hypothetical protein
MKKLAGAFVLAVGASLLCGCPNPNIYGTPRTTPQGKIQHIIAPEGISWSIKSPSAPGVPQQTTSINLPMFPSYHMRYGVSDNVDLGFKALNGSTLGFDAKFNPVRGGVDVAVAPGLQAVYYSFGSSSSGPNGSSSASVSGAIFYFHLPLLLGFNVSDSFAIVATPGVAVALATASATASGSGDTQSQVTGSGSAFMGRFGLGLNFRASDNFALQPEATLLKGFNDAASTIVVFGLGFNFGHLPVQGAGGTTTTAPSKSAPPPEE